MPITGARLPCDWESHESIKASETNQKQALKAGCQFSFGRKFGPTVALVMLASAMFAQTASDRLGPMVSALRREFEKALQLPEPPLKTSREQQGLEPHLVSFAVVRSRSPDIEPSQRRTDHCQPPIPTEFRKQVPKKVLDSYDR
jgi:hypothetical protein